ncbi:MAG: tyrosine-type recombinase/integrase [Leptospiraceae bacterium]|nr:tyrosine-type recombinase/integrase [Leptospiraceae bacterium]
MIKITSQLHYNIHCQYCLSSYMRLTGKAYITPILFSRYIRKLKEGKKYKANTIFNYLNWFNRLFREYYTHNPKYAGNYTKYKALIQINKVRKPRRVYNPDDVFTPDQFIELIQFIAAKNKKLSLIAMFLFYTGLRISEASRVRLMDCKVIENIVEIKIINGKGGRDRFVLCPLFVFNLAIEENPKIYLFEHSDFSKYSPRTLQAKFTEISKTHSKRVTAHLLRHSFATEHMSSGTNPETLADIMGNSVSTIIQTYNHPKIDKNKFNKVLLEKTNDLVKRYE